MPTVTLTPTAVSVTGSGGWATLEYYKNTSPNHPLTMNLTYPVNAVLSGPGVNITEITVHGYIRNKSTARRLIPAAPAGNSLTKRTLSAARSKPSTRRAEPSGSTTASPEPTMVRTS